MDKKKLAAAIAFTLMLASGCMNVIVRPQCDYNMGPYYCTKAVNKMISSGFDGKPLQQMLLPVMLADWPFDAVADTLLWPWDAWRHDARFAD